MKNKKNIQYMSFIIGIFGIFFGVTAHAAVDCSFSDGFNVTYAAGVPNPSSGTCELSITNDESDDLTVASITINSNSMAWSSVSTGWSCLYLEPEGPPNFSGQTMCTPDSALVLSPGAVSSFDLTFDFENMSDTGFTVPESLALDIVLNGTVSEALYSNLESSSWSVTVTGSSESEESDSDCSGSIGNTIWSDINKNGIQDDGEPGINDVEVCAYNGNDKECDKTNTKGRYRIEDLCDGGYDVRVKTEGVAGMTLVYDPDGKLDHKTEVKLHGDHDEHTKADFGYTENLIQTGGDSLLARVALFVMLLMAAVGMTYFGWKTKRA